MISSEDFPKGAVPIRESPNNGGLCESTSRTEPLEMLSELECGFQCLLDKVKEDMQAAKDAMLFLKKRAAIEEEYGKQMQKLAQSTGEAFDKAHPRSGTYGETWLAILKVHETVGEQRIKFAGDITEVADDLQLLCKDTDKGRKQVKDVGMKHEKDLNDADKKLEKCKQTYEEQSEKWEQARLQKNNDPLHVPRKGGFFKNNKTPAQQENSARMKVTKADSEYRMQLKNTNERREEYFTKHLPKILSDLKGVGDECNVALRYQLARYAYIFEQALTADGIALDNDDGLGLRSLTEKIDKDSDLVSYISTYNGRSEGVQRGEIPFKEYGMANETSYARNANPVFGVELDALMERDREEVPAILRKCVEAVEAYGLNTVGIYRLSGSASQIQELKKEFDRDCASVRLEDDKVSDINNITSVLKLWFRELPDPLFPRSTYQLFLNAAKIEDQKMRVLGLHTVINDLSDAHYAALKYLMCHLDKVQQNQRNNKMGSANLATIFGLTLMDGEPDTKWQVSVVQTILDNYSQIFETGDE